MTRVPGIVSTLFPEWYLAEIATRETCGDGGPATRGYRNAPRWWEGVAASCGPATGLRALFDVAAMPLFGMLGFRATDAVFERTRVRASLRSSDGSTVLLILLPWASRASSLWRDVWATAQQTGLRWSFVFAPPFLSLVETRGYAARRSVDFDLPVVFGTDSMRVFWTLCGSRSFERAAAPDLLRIDELTADAARGADRVRSDLQAGVAQALASLSRMLDGSSARARMNEALTLVYRVLFLRFAESRRLLPMHDPVYAGNYAIATLCREALRGETRGLWTGLAAATRLSRRGCRSHQVEIAPFNGRLFARSSAPGLERRDASARPSRRSTRRDQATRDALVALGSRASSAGRQELDFSDLGVEELGSVYERVLDLDPEAVLADEGRPSQQHQATWDRHSAIRKQTGTFYTPRALAEFVVRRTLGPLVAGRTPEEILALRVVDPAMGSGAFLVAACRYLADGYARALIADGRLAPNDLDEEEGAGIRRLVAEQCLSGVDLNPVAVQLARLSLWLTTLARGKPLGFLDHRLRVGNSLIGASAEDLGRIAGRRHKNPSALPLFDMATLESAAGRVVGPLRSLLVRPDDTVADVHAKQRLWAGMESQTSPLHPWRLAAGLWCAQWFWPTDAGRPSAPELRALIDAIIRGDRTLPPAHLARRIDDASQVAAQQRFFHWPFEFPDIFYDETGALKSAGGFDAVIGNPPWEMLRRDGPTSPRADPSRTLRFVRDSGVYRDCTTGHLNLYQPFLERVLTLCRPGGEIGLVLPWGAAVDDGAARLRQRLFDTCRIRTLVGLENSRALFPIHRGLRFLVMTASPGTRTEEISARFGVQTTHEIDQLPDDPVSDPDLFPVRLTSAAVRRVGGSGYRVPYLKHRDDLRLADHLTRAFPPLGSPNGWAARFGRELNATEDRGAFGPAGMPVIDGKHVAPFKITIPAACSRISDAAASRLLPNRSFDQRRLAYRDVSGYTNKYALIAAVIPRGVVTTHTLSCLRGEIEADALDFLCGLLNSYVLNALVRILMGSHLTTSLIEQLPVPRFSSGGRERRIVRLVRRLSSGTRTAFAISGALQAEVAHLYGLDDVAFDRVMASVPRVPPAERRQAVRIFELRRAGESAAR